MSLLLLGENRARHRGEWLPARQALEIAGLQPFTLAAKEGLALLNGTQVSTAYALRGLFEAEDLMSAALVCGGLSVEAMLGSRAPFDPRIHAARGQRGQIDVAAVYRDLLTDDSEVGHSHADCGKVQDPYSLRCQPQVMGACLTQIRQAAEVLAVEANAVSDNPLVFAAEGDVISGGNFHAEPVAMAADNLALALAEIGALSERRISLMMDKHMSQLPPFLVNNGGVNSGFMIAQVTAAALASDNKALAHPASVDSLPTSANQKITCRWRRTRAAPVADGRERARHPGHRMAGRLPGPGFPRGPEDLAQAGARAPAAAPEGGALREGPLLRARHRTGQRADRRTQPERAHAGGPVAQSVTQHWPARGVGPPAAAACSARRGRAGGARPCPRHSHHMETSMQEVQSSELKRGLSARHIRFIALGSAIGTGLFYGSAKAIQAAGPSVLIAYLIAGAAVYMVMRALGEMAVHNPVAGSFGQYASQSLGPLAGFITGWTYTFEMIIVCRPTSRRSGCTWDSGIRTCRSGSGCWPSCC